MKSTGVTRPLDKLGRVVIPMEVRENLNLKYKDLLEISVQGEQIILTKHNETCVFCKSADDLVIFEDKKVCKACLEKLSKLS